LAGFQIITTPGIKNMIFGGENIFLAVLQGQGTTWPSAAQCQAGLLLGAATLVSL
jgi:uncharacterized protein (AIM24 family)